MPLIEARRQFDRQSHEEVIILCDYKNIGIGITRHGTFTCQIDGIEYTAREMSEIHNQINRHFAAKSRLAKAAPLDLAVTCLVCDGPVYGDKSEIIVAHGAITGIDCKTGNVVISSPGIRVGWHWLHVLVDTPENRQLLADLAEARTHERKLDDRVAKRDIKYERGHHIEFVDYAKHVDKLVKEYREKSELSH